MSRTYLWMTAVVLICIAGTSTAVASDWERVDQTDGVTVYERDAGDDVAFRGTMEADIHIGELIATFVNPDQRPHWVDNYGDHETIEQSASSELYWLQLDMPFGVSDRDYVLRAQYNFDEANRTFTATTQSVEDRRKPEDDCCVRAESNIEYVFRAEPGEQTTHIEVDVQSDLKGRVPSRIVNSAQREWPVATLNALVDRTRSSGVDADSRAADWHRE